MSTHIAYVSNTDFMLRFNQLRSQVFGIQISEGITPSLARSIIAQIDDLYSQLRLDYAILTSERSRVDSLIKEIERANADGKNETDRRKNATVAVREYQAEEGAEVFNLYQIYQQVNHRNELIDSLVDILDKKQSRLVTVTGLLKLDKELSGHS